MLKLDPKNTELLTQKQTVLNNTISTTAEKLKNLKDVKAKADEALANGTKISEENYRSLQREIINTQKKLSDLKNEASNWTKAGNYFTNLSSDLDKVAEKIDSLGNKLTKSLTAPIAAIATAGVTYDAQIEKYETAFKTFLGSTEAAQNAIQKLKEDAKNTPFDTTSIVKANQMLISTGVSADDARQDILALGEAVIATGGGNDELVRMSSNLQQIRNAGKATAMDIRQFAYAGIDVYGILADYTGKTTKEVKNMEVTYEDLTKALKKASSQGGKYYGAMTGSSKTLTGQISALKSEVQDMLGSLTKSLMPIAKKVVTQVRNIIAQFDKLSDSQKENIVKIGLMVAAAGPLLKIGSSAISIISNVSNGVGTFTKAISLAHNGIGTATGSAANLAKVFQALTSPIGLAAVGITTAVGLIVLAMENAEKSTKEAFNNMGNSATDFITGISTAKSHLEDFNTELFVSSQEQQELNEQMQEVQQGITQICRTASEERRNYTQEEITQLDEYFERLRALNQREIEIQQSISEAITQQAQTNAAVFKGTLEEYKIQSQEWINTAIQQKERTVDLIDQQTIQEVALLNQRYSTEESRQSEAYQTEYANIINQKEEKIAAANAEVAKISEVYSEGYLERVKQSDGFYKYLKEANERQQKLENDHADKIKAIKKGEGVYASNINGFLKSENTTHANNMKLIWDKMYENMSEEQEKELGIWLAQVAQTELYGGKIDDETKEIVDGILKSYDSMPPKTREAMKNAMSPMLTEMEKTEPGLFAKAKSIAEGILSRLRSAFDINSPSRKTREIFRYVMEGAELGLEDERINLNNQVNDIAKEIQSDFGNIDIGTGSLQKSVIDKTKTIFTTPNITFNVQKMDKENLNTAFNYINRRLGSEY